MVTMHADDTYDDDDDAAYRNRREAADAINVTGAQPARPNTLTLSGRPTYLLRQNGKMERKAPALNSCMVYLLL